MMKTAVVALAFITVLVSCKQGNNPTAIDAINQSLQHSNELINQYCNTSCRKLEDKVSKPETKNKASIWFPKAAKVKILAATVNQYIDSLQEQLAIFKPADHVKAKQLIDKESYILFDKLVKYRESLLQVVDIREFSDNPGFQGHLKADFKNFRKLLTTYLEIGTDTTLVSMEGKHAWVNNYLRSNTVLQMQAMLSGLKSDVLLTASMMIDYYGNQVGWVDGEFYYTFQVITLINSYQVKAEQPVEITVGQGHFITNVENLQVKANNYDMKLTSDGTFIYKFIARGKPGIWCIPITVQFDKPDGSIVAYTKQLEYTITQ